jgi:two-component system response regulator BaeR
MQDRAQQKIIIVEDEPKIARLMADYLQAQGHFETRCVDRGDEAVEAILKGQHDLVLLDLMLPGLDGVEVCKQVRAQSDIPIIMVTARVEEIDRLLGLELGADDYICKPFSPREVVARVKAVLRRTGVSAESSRAASGLEIDAEQFLAHLNGRKLNLTPVEFALLQALAGQPGRVFSRDRLMNEMYSDYRVVSDRAVDTHIKNLRKKLSAASDGRELIESVYGLGYRFIS